MLLKRLIIGIMAARLVTCADFDWNLPKGFPRPPVPADNPMSAAKVELGAVSFLRKAHLG